MYRAAPVSLAGWRHQVSSVVMLPFFLAEWRRLPKFERAKCFTFRSLGLYFVAALGLSGNLGFYVRLSSLFRCVYAALHVMEIAALNLLQALESVDCRSPAV